MKYELGRCRLRDIRHEINWTQVALAELTGISKDVLSKYENNKNTMTYFNSILITEIIYEKTGKRYSPRDLYEVVQKSGDRSEGES